MCLVHLKLKYFLIKSVIVVRTADPMCRCLVSLLVIENSKPLKRIHFTFRVYKKEHFSEAYFVSVQRGNFDGDATFLDAR